MWQHYKDLQGLRDSKKHIFGFRVSRGRYFAGPGLQKTILQRKRNSDNYGVIIVGCRLYAFKVCYTS